MLVHDPTGLPRPKVLSDSSGRSRGGSVGRPSEMSDVDLAYFTQNFTEFFTFFCGAVDKVMENGCYCGF